MLAVDPEIPVIEIEEPPIHTSPRLGKVLATGFGIVGLTAVLVWLAGALVAPPADHRLLVADDEGSITLLDPVGGGAVYTVTDAVAAPDRSAVHRAVPVDDGTVVQGLDPASGGSRPRAR